MKTDQPKTIRLEDYRAPDYRVDEVTLTFDLDPHATRVISAVRYVKNPETQTRRLELDGNDLTLQHIALNGKPLSEDAYLIEDDKLFIEEAPDDFELVIETEIDPKGNTQLNGLYQSSGTYCTQCEAQGFRRITYFPDRPDVMARYRVTILADKATCPVLLSNGNLIESGDLEDGKHYALWEDPFNKPSYLFALVAGDLALKEDTFTTCSGRTVDLRIFVEHGFEDGVDYAMDSLKRSMKWDEERFDLEYDLDLYNIVAVSDFNMGAMENKSLNVFNTKYVLAKPDTATDLDFAGIEAVIAHEYFHNWTGNRVTCRDWFQLSLKEGLTVFRDQEFSSDMRSRPVERISAVKMLRAGQFPEDAGPLAHPVRPESYISIDNFYTATVYNKGAEVIRMMHTLLGEETFQKGMKLYFERHDGQAVTCDDFAQAMMDASGLDLTQFKLWYSQAGTPRVKAAWAYDADAKRFDLTLEQSLDPTPGQEVKEIMHIPFAIGLLDESAQEIESRVLSLKERIQTFSFQDIPAPPRVSLNRDFSAPIKLDAPYSDEDMAFLAAHDPNPFARWEILQTFALKVLLKAIEEVQNDQTPSYDPTFITALKNIILDPDLDSAFKALCLVLPTESYIADQMAVVDVEAIHKAREGLRLLIAEGLKDDFLYNWRSLRTDAPYRPDAEQSGNRALRNVSLAYLSEINDPAIKALVPAHYHNASNMTDRMSALITLSNQGGPEAEAALDDFYKRFKHDPLVVDKWLSTQAFSYLPETLDRVKTLMDHEAFSLKNPNKVRALIGCFVHGNQLNYHKGDGSGYRFNADMVLKLDGMNPQVAARLITPLGRWRRFDDARQKMMKAELTRIVETDGLSKDTFEMASKSLQ